MLKGKITLVLSTVRFNMTHPKYHMLAEFATNLFLYFFLYIVFHLFVLQLFNVSSNIYIFGGVKWQIYLQGEQIFKRSMLLLTLIFQRTQKHICTGYVEYSFLMQFYAVVCSTLTDILHAGWSIWKVWAPWFSCEFDHI